VGVSSETGTAFTTEESSATSVETSVTVSAEVGGDAAGGTVGGSGTVAAGQVDTRAMSNTMTTAIGQERGAEAGVSCHASDYPWANGGDRLLIWQYSYNAKSRSNGDVLLETYDWLCIPASVDIVPKCPPQSCDDAVCSRCPEYGLTVGELPDCTDNFGSCDWYTWACNNVHYADWFMDNCAASCGWCAEGMVADGGDTETKPEDREPGKDATQEDWDAFWATHPKPPVTEGIQRTGTKVALQAKQEAIAHFNGEDDTEAGPDAASFMKVGPVSEGISGGLVAVTVIAVLGALATCAYLARRVSTLKKQEQQMLDNMPAQTNVESTTYDVITQ